MSGVNLGSVLAATAVTAGAVPAADGTADGTLGAVDTAVCLLCGPDDDKAVHLVARSREWRVVRVLDNPDHPAFWRVICNGHAAELTDLEPAQRSAMMQAVCKVEAVVRRELQPHKVNLASLGNVVPHLHWHVVARWQGDPHFPQPIWGMRQRDAETTHLMRLEVQLPQVDRAIQAELMNR